MKYMGDYSVKQTQPPIELSDQIFAPATQYEALQDEIYCQIMRQMTGNGNRWALTRNVNPTQALLTDTPSTPSLVLRASMDRGWQLMWLCLGLFPPSQLLVGHVRSFLESQPKDQLSADCLRRLQVIRRSVWRNKMCGRCLKMWMKKCSDLQILFIDI